ncbi:galactose mutarotase [Gracilaria domingensis]|nr:galactose mutarotase [Gracilaria domingensis]
MGGSQQQSDNVAPRTTHIEGTTRNGDFVNTIHLRSETGAEASVLTRGARVLDLRFSTGPNRLITYTDLAAVEADGAAVNVVVGRIANRTRNGRLTRYPQIDSNAHLELNDQGHHHIHGGSHSWDKRLFTVRARTESTVELFMVSPDGDQGYPGIVEVTVRYHLKGDVQLEAALTTKNIGRDPTVSNLTLHPYFDLSGRGGTVADSVLSYRMQATACEQYLVLDDDNVPTGLVSPVQGTRFDFTEERSIDDGSTAVKGYDNFLIAKSSGGDGHAMQTLVAVILSEQGSSKGVKMEVQSDQQGFQVYTANGFSGAGKEKFAKYGSIAIEPSNLIDACNHDHFPCAALNPNETRTQRISYNLSELA